MLVKPSSLLACVRGSKVGTGNAHPLLNRTCEEVHYLEAGERSAGDCVEYPDDDLQAILVEGK